MLHFIQQTLQLCLFTFGAGQILFFFYALAIKETNKEHYVSGFSIRPFEPSKNNFSRRT